MIPLPKDHYYKLTSLVDIVDFNNLFAKAVIDGVVSGRVYVDNVENPCTYYILHRYGMSLLGGKYNNEEFNRAFFEYATDSLRTSVDWMQVFPTGWNPVLREMFKQQFESSAIELNSRVNFRFEVARYRELRGAIMGEDPSVGIARFTPGLFDKMTGSVVPNTFWDSAEDFERIGVGFCLYKDGELAATSFSSFRAPGRLEIGIEVFPKFRGMGLSEKVCATLIDYCLHEGLEPLWACRLENTASYKLAQKLGFVVALEMPYYRF